MALSSDEHALLVTTCGNMNTAASTCREVLEMLRSLGNTGVVDIATHNNAAEPHANATNIFHVLSNGTAVLGTKGESGAAGWEGYYDLRFDRVEDTKSYNLVFLAANRGETPPDGPTIRTYYAITDSGGNLIDPQSTAYSLTDLQIGMIEWNCACSDGYHTVRIAARVGNISSTGNDKTSNFSIYVDNEIGGNYRFFEFNYSSFLPVLTNVISLGLPGRVFSTAYLGTAATVTSDRREKTGISALDSKAIDFVKALRPVQYTVRHGKSNLAEPDEKGDPTSVEIIPGTRRHWGLIAQEVKEAMTSAGYEDAAVWCLADKDDPDSRQSLRYEELIAPMIKVIQNQQERIEALERKVA